MRSIILALSFAGIFGCHPDQNKQVDLEKLQFQSTDASEIFFRNVRRSYYDIEENSTAAIELYTLSDYKKFEEGNIRPTLAYNWRNDFVAVMLNRSTKLSSEENLVLLFENSEGSQKLIWNESDIKTQTAVAVKVYNAILNNDAIFFVQDRQKQPLFDSNEEKDLFRITIFDFLRFVEMR